MERIHLHDRANGAPWGRQDRLVNALLLLVVFLPFGGRMLALFIVLVALASVALRIQHGAGQWQRPSATSAMTWMALFFLFHVLGMAWSSNIDFGLFDLEVKASFMLFPVLFWLIPSNERFDLSRVWRGFAWANAGAVILCLATACWRFGQEWILREQGQLPAAAPWTNHFFESRFALFLHPSYMAMYLCFALAAVQLGGLGLRQVVQWSLSAVLVIGVILCNSKMGWLTLALVTALAMVAGWQDRLVRRRLLTLSGIGLVFFGALFLAFPTVSGKITQALSVTEDIDPTSDQSSALRRMAWGSAVDLFTKHPFTGVGTGDIKDELIQVYHAKGYVHAEAKRINAHSQFLQSAAALGVGALLVLIVMFAVPLVLAIRRRDLLTCSFWLILLLNWMVESMAEVQAGVMFASTFAWLLGIGRRT